MKPNSRAIPCSATPQLPARLRGRKDRRPNQGGRGRTLPAGGRARRRFFPPHALQGNRCCVVDAETQADLNHFADQLRAAAAQGKRFLFRPPPACLTALARCRPQPVAATAMHAYVRDNGVGKCGGAVIVGSHVKKTTAQLEKLLQVPGVVALEVDVDRILSARAKLLAEVAGQRRNRPRPRRHTSSTPAASSAIPRQASRLAFGEAVSGFLMDAGARLPASLAFSSARAGITSNDVLSTALA